MDKININPSINEIPSLNDVQGAMENRHSRRAFTNQSVEAGKIKRLEELCRFAKDGYFGEDIQMHLLDKSKLLDKNGINLNDGFGKNWFSAIYPKELLFRRPEKLVSPETKIVKALPQYFLVAAVREGPVSTVENTPYGPYDFQYGSVGAAAEFYKGILGATELELNSCISGFLVEDVFRQAMDLTGGWKIPLMSPIGYSPNLAGIEKRIRRGHKSDSRFDFGRVFFNVDSKPLDANAAGDYWAALEAVRQGPSAGNHQAWRLFKDSDLFHLYVILDPKRKDYRIRHLNEMDAGIAMVNFGYVAKQHGIQGNWRSENPGLKLPSDHLYVASFGR